MEQIKGIDALKNMPGSNIFVYVGW